MGFLSGMFASLQKQGLEMKYISERKEWYTWQIGHVHQKHVVGLIVRAGLVVQNVAIEN